MNAPSSSVPGYPDPDTLGDLQLLLQLGSAIPNNPMDPSNPAVQAALGASGVGVNVGLARPVIVDTDWFTDLDDVFALRVVTWAARRNLINLRGVNFSVTSTSSQAAIMGLLAYDGLAGVPVSTGPYTAFSPTGTNSYNAAMVAATTSPAVPSTLDALSMYRTLLARSIVPVDIISTGTLSNLQELLQSPADSISPLTGLQLVTAKVGTLWMTGGAWPSGSEYNLITNPSAASYVFANWPGKIVMNGSGPMQNVPSGAGAVGNLPAADPVSVAAAAYAGGTGGRPSWDPATAYIAIWGSLTSAGFTGTTGTATVNASTGANTFAAGAGKHTYVTSALPDRAYQAWLESVIDPALQPAALAVAAEMVFAGKYQSGVTDYGNLIAWYEAADAGVADTANVAYLPDRMGNYPLIQPTSGNQPVYAASKVGKNAIAFGGSKALYSANKVPLPQQVTIYVQFEVDALPGATATLIDNGWGNSYGRTGKAQLLANGKLQWAGFSGATVTTAQTSTSASTATWTIASIVRNLTGYTVALAGAGAVTTSATGSNRVNAPILIGATKSDGSQESFTGWVSRVRIYNGAHTSAQQTAVLAEMA